MYATSDVYVRGCPQPKIIICTSMGMELIDQFKTMI